MLLFTLLTFSVFLNANAFQTDMDGLVLIEYIERLPPDFLITHEVTSNAENFAVADFEQSNESSPELRIQLHNIYLVAALDKPCTLTESVRKDSINASLTTFKRLKDDKVVIVWYDELQGNTDRRFRIIVAHLESCRVINRDMNELRGNPIVVPMSDGNFDVFIDDEEMCNGAQCVIKYDLKADEYSKPKPFDFDVEWKNLEIDRLDDGNLIVRGFKNSNYKVMLVNKSNGQSKLLMSILAVNPRLEFKSSGLSFCWTFPSVDISVRCAQFDDKGELIFSSTVKLNDGRKVTLYHVQNVGKGKIFFVVGTITCRVPYDCWNLTIAEVNENKKLTVESSKFRCTGDRKRLSIFDVVSNDNTTIVRYACRYENGYAYDKNEVQTKVVVGKEIIPACQLYGEDTQLFCS